MAWFRLVLSLISEDREREITRRQLFSASLAVEGGEDFDGPEAERFASGMADWALKQVVDPSRVQFGECRVRHCPDGIIRVTGPMQITGDAGRLTTTWYIGEFLRDGRLRYADLVDFDPVPHG